MAINCIIIEDEPLAMQRIKDFVLRVPFLKLLYFFDNAIEAIGFLKTEKIDLLFLDIQMDGFTGIQLLESINNRPDVIVTTAFDQYALKSFDLNVTDYLLKPYTFERFMQAVTKVYDRRNSPQKNGQKTYIFIKTEYRLEKVDLDDILFIEGMRDYRCLHLPGKRIMTPETFGDLENELPKENFCRVHKSFIIALSKINSIEKDRIRINDRLIPISDTYKDDFYRSIKH
jgi:two-component system LytT family response regulator